MGRYGIFYLITVKYALLIHKILNFFYHTAASANALSQMFNCCLLVVAFSRLHIILQISLLDFLSSVSSCDGS